MRVYVYKKTLKGQVFSDKKNKPLKTNSKQRYIYIYFYHQTCVI